VSVVNLEAIENGDFHSLPVPIYTKNFIKTYANALRIDSKPILDNYEAYLNSLKPAENPALEEKNNTISVIATIGRYKKLLWASLLILVVATVAFFISQQYSTTENLKQPIPLEKEVIAPPEIKQNIIAPLVLPPVATPAEQPKASVQAQPEEIKKQTKAPAPFVAQLPKSTVSNTVAVQTTASIPITQPAGISDEPNLLVIKASEETWLRIKADQNPAFQVLLKPGDKIERKAAIFDIDIGNAAGIKLQFKGKAIDNLGKSGQVIHLRLP
jgi:cytoskeleton protein RodZ